MRILVFCTLCDAVYYYWEPYLAPVDEEGSRRGCTCFVCNENNLYKEINNSEIGGRE